MSPVDLYDSDLVFHYTTREAALEHILPTGRLRLSRFGSVRDPFERLYGVGNVRGYINGNPGIHPTDENKAMAHLDHEMNTYRRSSWFSSFCAHRFQNDETNLPVKTDEDCGFLKPRMWDQYGQAFCGICLAFSKTALTRTLEKQGYPLFFCESVSYQPYRKLVATDLSAIVELDSFRRPGMNDDDFLRERAPLIYLSKHTDFIDENEWRICVVDKARQDDFLFIDCTTSLRAIMYCYHADDPSVPDLFPSVYIELLKSRFSPQYGIPLVEISWTSREIGVCMLHPENNFERVYM